ncbi:hypothetical protein RJ639_019612 [Escallonia herrerae]|uniref:FCP1 homology domain-containing protein n=1 Tax=Escallonia herrerae TaxID=1293975 RepID=A0AA89AIP0_9ASTE|nr:hypothetical protein RJ639_019612 [Escallonia herrerae]
MVSRIIKRTLTTSIKDRKNHHHHQQSRRKRSPIKKAAAATASVVVASFNKSIHICHRRLVKIFNKLVKIGTPKRTPRKKGYQFLNKVAAEHSPDVRRPLFATKTLPPVYPPMKKTVFLDLDETLVHSKPDPPPEKYDFIVRPVIDGERVDFYVLKRPLIDEFLVLLAKKFEVVVFTAGVEQYASLVLDRVDKGAISHRLYRDSCREVDGKFVKDLSGLGRDLGNVVIVDDNPNSFALQPENAIPIRPFTEDLEDRELGRLIEFFEGCDGFEDMRDAVKHYLGGVCEEGKKVEL